MKDDLQIKAATLTADPRDMEYFWIGTSDGVIRLRVEQIPKIIDALTKIKSGRQKPKKAREK